MHKNTIHIHKKCWAPQLIHMNFFSKSKIQYFLPAASNSTLLTQLAKNELKIPHLCLTLCNPMDYTYTVHGIFQDRILEWVDFPFSRESSQPRNPGLPHCRQIFFLPDEPQKVYCVYTIINYSGKKDQLFHHWASLMAQMVKNLPAMQETRV